MGVVPECVAVDVDYKSRFARIVETLTHANGEECRILLHELVGDLMLGGQSRRDGGSRERVQAWQRSP